MASTISTPATYLPSSFKQKKSTTFSTSSSLLLHPQTTNYRLSTSIPPLGLGLLSPWDGLRHSGIPVKQKCIKIERRKRSKDNVVHASLFGVGAPEALVIGVVALLVFGPKGLAEVARNLGKTLRSFQPTIRELQDVSREFKSTLEREIGLDDAPPSMQNSRSSTTSANSQNSQTTLDQNGTPLTNRPSSTEDYLKTTEDQLEAMTVQQQTTPQEQSENQSQVQDDAPPATKPFNLGELLVEAQIRSKTQEQMVPQEGQSELEPEPKGLVVPQEAQSELEPQPTEVAPTMSPSKKLESEK